MTKKPERFQPFKALNIINCLLALQLSMWVSEAAVGGVCGLSNDFVNPPMANDDSQPPVGLFNLQEFPNEVGKLGVFHVSTDSDVFIKSSSFFSNLGTNQRTCGTCHLLKAAGGFDASSAAQQFVRFNDANNVDNSIPGQRGTSLLDPLFRPFDGSWTVALGQASLLNKNDPDYIDPCIAYNNLIQYGLIKVIRDIPPGAQFTLAGYLPGVVSGIEISPEDPAKVTVYRRPLPAANLGRLNDDETLAQDFTGPVMWDMRESVNLEGFTFVARKPLKDALLQQFEDATLGHAQLDGTFRSYYTDNAIDGVNFEMGLFSAQNSLKGLRTDEADENNNKIGPFASGGAYNVEDSFLAARVTAPDPLSTTGRTITKVFDLFDAWATSTDKKKKAILDGQELFNGTKLLATKVAGVKVVAGCQTCHSRNNIGSSIGFGGTGRDPGFNIGISSNTGPSGATLTGSQSLDPALFEKLIKYTLNKTDGLPVNCGANGRLSNRITWVTTDPGLALTTGLWCDIDKKKTPRLRGLHRQPYFANGSGTNLRRTVELYQGLLNVRFTSTELDNLVAFLEAL
ncbi:exported hypothetical protein [Candidatus Methylobacter favarea]|uniref:Cytochrome c domain-containing protein n=1 Tax=Candidatus Methylobacter favarea TaxID=2707345 RepID=A0A8S0WL10_9GAMM|nr:hypothetical protein [Candidatus Methylobacter favarea]CAA9892330.1 exported hypothetical protein [Candidatus Methylobacter favarea]